MSLPIKQRKQAILSVFERQGYPYTKLRKKTHRREICIRRQALIYCLDVFAHETPHEIQKLLVISYESVWNGRRNITDILSCKQRGCEWFIVNGILTEIRKELGIP